MMASAAFNRARSVLNNAIDRFNSFTGMNVSRFDANNTNLDSLKRDKINHILNGSKGHDHKWRKVVSDDQNWNEVKEVIRKTLNEGIDGTIHNGNVNTSELLINDNIVHVRYKVIGGYGKIGDAWVK